jgi:hypothetical protein
MAGRRPTGDATLKIARNGKHDSRRYEARALVLSARHELRFDVTPARLATGLITAKGIVAANRKAIAALFPDRTAAA